MRTIWKRCWAPAPALSILLAVSPPSSPAPADGVLSVPAPPPLAIAAGGAATLTLTARLQRGYHVNSHQPAEEYIIPLRLSWEAAPLAVEEIIYPEPRLERYSFADKPLSVFTGDFPIRTRFRAPAGASPGPRTLTGKLRYQACTDTLCLPPKTVTLSIPVEIR